MKHIIILLLLLIVNTINLRKSDEIRRRLVEINVDDRIGVCASAKICFNDLCEIIDEETYNSHEKYCNELLNECYKMMDEMDIP